MERRRVPERRRCVGMRGRDPRRRSARKERRRQGDRPPRRRQLGDVIAEDEDIYGDGSTSRPPRSAGQPGGICIGARRAAREGRAELGIRFRGLGRGAGQETSTHPGARPRCILLDAPAGRRTDPVGRCCCHPIRASTVAQSIAVLSFCQQSDERCRTGIFLEGITEDIITRPVAQGRVDRDLARSPRSPPDGRAKLRYRPGSARSRCPLRARGHDPAPANQGVRINVPS